MFGSNYFWNRNILQNNFSPYKMYGGSNLINRCRLLTESTQRNPLTLGTKCALNLKNRPTFIHSKVRGIFSVPNFCVNPLLQLEFGKIVKPDAPTDPACVRAGHRGNGSAGHTGRHAAFATTCFDFSSFRLFFVTPFSFRLSLSVFSFRLSLSHFFSMK